MAEIKWKTKEEIKAEEEEAKRIALMPSMQEQIEAQAQALEDMITMIMEGGAQW